MRLQGVVVWAFGFLSTVVICIIYLLVKYMHLDLFSNCFLLCTWHILYMDYIRLFRLKVIPIGVALFTRTFWPVVVLCSTRSSMFNG